MDMKVCRRCGLEKNLTNFNSKRKLADGTRKRSNICRSCINERKVKKIHLEHNSQIVQTKEFPEEIVFSEHALKRCRLRGIDTSRLIRTLWSINFLEGRHRFPIKESPLVVIYEDEPERRKRVIITVIKDTSLRHHNKI